MNHQKDELRRQVMQLVAHIREIPPTLRIGILVVVIVIVFGFLGTRYSSNGNLEILLADVNRERYQELEAAFLKSNLQGSQWVDGQVMVPADQRERFSEVMSLQSFGVDIGNKSEAISKSSILLPPQTQSNRVLNGLEKDLAGLITRGMPEIDQAYVHFDREVTRGLRDKKVATAAVCVISNQSQTLTLSSVETIRRMVASAVAGMSVADVTLTDLSTGRSYGGTDQETMDWRIQDLEDGLRRKVQTILQIPDAEVAVSLQAPSEIAQPEAVVDLNSFSKIAITISVPRRHYETAYAIRKASRMGRPVEFSAFVEQTEESMRQGVVGLLPDPSKHLVTFTMYDDLQPVAAANPPLISGQLRRWSGALALVFAGLGILMIHLINRRASQEVSDSPATQQIFPIHDELHEQSVTEMDDREDDDDLRTKLTDVVRDDPDQAARILNQWIGKTG